MHRLAGLPHAPPHPFGDVSTPWQQDAIAWLVYAGVTTGTSPTTYAPDAPVTRAQLAAFLHRYRGRPPVTVDASTPFCERSRTPREITATEWTPFATTGPVSLTHPAARVELIGFHESNHDGARQMDPSPSAATWTTLETRNRGNGRRTAADIAVGPTEEIRAPVTGTVVRSGGYVLYCDIADEFVVIEPDDRPGWEVKILHIDGVTVGRGERVMAGSTVVARRATQLPFVSQVDEHTAEPSWPHVHVEVVDPSVPDRPGRGC
jgi:murein DD-endopeptidase MepM/ murein hydrolase activator NlpD